MRRHLPNAITCGNLLCGCLGLVEVLSHNVSPAFGGFFIGLAALLDFFDGLVARWLGVSSPIGKELDSLADVVSFGVLPAAMWYRVLMDWAQVHEYVALLAFALAIFSALRLAKFNVDTRQSDQFIGLPTPANALLIAALTFVLESFEEDPVNLFLSRAFSRPPVALGLIPLMCYLMVAELPLLSFKFKNFDWPGNEARFILLLLSGVLLIFFNFAAVPFIILAYIGISLYLNWRARRPSHP